MTKGYKHLTVDQKRAILEYYESCQIVSEVAAQVECSGQQVRGYLKKNNVSLVGHKVTRCYKNLVLVRKLADEGKSYSEISRVVGTNHHRVKECFERYGIEYNFDQSMENNPKWKGGRMIDKDGYVLVKNPSHPHCTRHGYVREHRLVMEAYLGRYLDPKEVVHHKDKDKSNNSIDNLGLYSTNADHLAETLKGKMPNFSEGKIDKLPPGIRRAASRLREANLKT